MLNISKMHMMQVLYEVVAPIECAMDFGFIPALLVLVARQMDLIRPAFSAKGAFLKRFLLVGAAYPGRTQCVYRVLVTVPFILGLERPWTEGAEEGKISGRQTGIIEPIDLRPTVR
jgi:hypothetical protein